MGEAQRKAGIKTSEFWVGVLTAPIVAIIVAFMNEIGVPVTQEMVFTFAAPAIAYIIGRVWTKSTEVRASVKDIL
jgi:hypothetical protein